MPTCRSRCKPRYGSLHVSTRCHDAYTHVMYASHRSAEYRPNPGLPGIDGDNEIIAVFTRSDMLKEASAKLMLRIYSVRPDFSK